MCTMSSKGLLLKLAFLGSDCELLNGCSCSTSFTLPFRNPEWHWTSSLNGERVFSDLQIPLSPFCRILFDRYLPNLYLVHPESDGVGW